MVIAPVPLMVKVVPLRAQVALSPQDPLVAALTGMAEAGTSCRSNAIVRIMLSFLQQILINIPSFYYLIVCAFRTRFFRQNISYIIPFSEGRSNEISIREWQENSLDLPKTIRKVSGHRVGYRSKIKWR